MARMKKTAGKAASTQPPELTPQQKSIMALQPCVNGAAVVEAFQSNLTGKEPDMNSLIAGLRGTFEHVHAGDLQMMERMLVAQATALQSMFASLARRAVHQEHLRQYEAFMNLALKAQSQSRATISALVELKYPKQATFVKQANISHGAQQVNNGTPSPARAEEPQPEQSKLLESDHGQPGGGLDTGAQAARAGSHSAVEAVAEVHGAEERRR